MTDLHGRVLRDARVFSHGPDRTPLEVRVDDDGNFVMHGVGAGPEVRLWIDEDDHARLRLHDICVFPNQVTDLGNVAMAQGHRIRLRAVDRAGHPIAGAMLTCEFRYRHMAHTVQQNGPNSCWTTDERGMCTSPMLGLCDHDLFIEADGYRRVWVPNDSQPLCGTVDLGDLVLVDEPLIVRGRVVDEAGLPVAQARVEFCLGEIEPTQSADDGSFQLVTWDGTRTHAVTASKRGYTTAWSGEEDDGQITIRLEARWILGRAIDVTTDEPVHVVSMQLLPMYRGPNGELLVAHCSETQWEDLGNGRFQIGFRSDGEYRLHAVCANGLEGRFDLVVPEDRQPPPEFVVPCAEPVNCDENDNDDRETERELPLPTRDPVCVTRWGWARRNAPNMDVRRGCATHAASPVTWLWCERDKLRFPHGSSGPWFTVDAPGEPRQWYHISPTQDDGFLPRPTGSLRGRVMDIHPDLVGHVWVVAFCNAPILVESRVDVDGSFFFPALPVGIYGLRAGDDSCKTLFSEHEALRLDEFDWAANPWPGAVRVEVDAGRHLEEIEIQHDPTGVHLGVCVPRKQRATKYLFKSDLDVRSGCKCKDQLAMFPRQLDCPWCGCGWRFTCSSCRETYVIAEVRETDLTLEDIGRRVLDHDLYGELTDDEVHEWCASMERALEYFEVGDLVAYLDGTHIPLDATRIRFDGHYARHELNELPQARARHDPAAVDRILGDAEYWRHRAHEQE
ncbi:MAG: carboxypeptidase regulatory-like domain-containing protein [Planctomycetes bacterium]|nr:carboxypeptidase regulatory-like domain-containing protein [Planctomycetota bacterium]